MAVKTKDDIMKALKEKLGEDTSDEALAFIEDISDTMDDLEKKSKGDGTNWKEKYDELDASWRKKYKDRFFGGEQDGDAEFKNPVENDPDPEQEKESKIQINDLFTEKK